MRWILNPQIDKRKLAVTFLLSTIVWCLGTAIVLPAFGRTSLNNGVPVFIGGILFFVVLYLFTTFLVALLFGVIDMKEELFVRKNGSGSK